MAAEKKSEINRFFNAIRRDRPLHGFAIEFYKRLVDFSVVSSEQEAVDHRFSIALDELERFSRRLDSMARILVGGDICAAVCRVGNKLYIATNRNGSELGPRINNLWTHLRTLAKMTSESGKQITYYEMIEYARKDALLGGMIDFVCQRFKQEVDKEQVRVLCEALIDDFNQYVRDVKRITYGVADDWSDHFIADVLPQHAKEVFNQAWKSEENWVLIAAIRYFQDIIKLEGTFSNINEFPEFVTSVANDRLQPTQVRVGLAKTHAEMRILEQLLNAEEQTNYIGISKLCCAHCNLVMNTSSIVQVFNDENQQPVRGFHGNPYNWPLSDCFLDNNAFLQDFLGEDLFLTFSTFKDNKRDLALQVITSIAKFSSKQLRSFGIEQVLRKQLPETADPSIAESRDTVLTQYQQGMFDLRNKQLVKISDGLDGEAAQLIGEGPHPVLAVRLPLSTDLGQSAKELSSTGENDIAGDDVQNDSTVAALSFLNNETQKKSGNKAKSSSEHNPSFN